MFNLLPVVMLLLMQGIGDVNPTFRHQQAMLDLAQRVGAVQNIEDLEDLLSDSPGLDSHQIASWIDAFYALRADLNPAPVWPEQEAKASQVFKAWDEPLPADCFLSSARTRDGPSI